MDAAKITSKLSALGGPSPQSSEWLTALLDGLWPNINAAAQNYAKENLPGILEASKPKFISSITVNRLELGHTNPKIGNFKVTTGEEPLKDVAIELDFQWYSKQDIEVTVQLMPDDSKYLPSFLDKAVASMTTFTFGIEEMEFDGRMRVTLRPLLNVLPVAGALQISFVERPHIDFKLTWGKGANEDKWSPFIMNWLIKAIDSYIASSMLLPDHFFVPMVQDAPDITNFDGVLSVTVVEAVNVPNMDWMGSSDTYIELYLREKKKYKTKSQGGESPNWGESFQLVVMEEQHQELIVSMMDDDVDKDDEIGKASIFVRDLPHGSEHVVNLQLNTPPQAKAPPAGKECKLTLKVKYSPFTRAEVAELVNVQLKPKEYQLPTDLPPDSLLLDLIKRLKAGLTAEKPKTEVYG